ncbi:hypothetical protein FZC76_17410 [Sutcliffiella horikoshii]|uniref:Uncharacterized protein n=1 Tax=Sutcliffiella horikoshii TaxID=79883 RepID=A0A5D4STU7_9BACI|nr:hypothetical protein FZC76_17410 [Sutcliffiella horikoshii]
MQTEEAHGPPAGKRSAWNGNQQSYLLSKFIKSPSLEGLFCFLLHLCKDSLQTSKRFRLNFLIIPIAPCIIIEYDIKHNYRC